MEAINQQNAKTIPSHFLCLRGYLGFGYVDDRDEILDGFVYAFISP